MVGVWNSICLTDIEANECIDPNDQRRFVFQTASLQFRSFYRTRPDIYDAEIISNVAAQSDFPSTLSKSIYASTCEMCASQRCNSRRVCDAKYRPLSTLNWHKEGIAEKHLGPEDVVYGWKVDGTAAIELPPAPLQDWIRIDIEHNLEAKICVARWLSIVCFKGRTVWFDCGI